MSVFAQGSALWHDRFSRRQNDLFGGAAQQARSGILLMKRGDQSIKLQRACDVGFKLLIK